MFSFLKRKPAPINNSERAYLKKAAQFRKDDDDVPDDDELLRQRRQWQNEDARKAKIRKVTKPAGRFIGDMVQAGKVAAGVKKTTKKKSAAKRKTKTKRRTKKNNDW